MNEAEQKHRASGLEDEARTLVTLCAQANAARRQTISLRMGEGARDVSRLPRRLVASN